MKNTITLIIGLALVAGITGCTSVLNTPDGKVLGVTSRVFGINIAASGSASTATPAIQLGMISQTVWIFPTSTNRLYAAPVASTLNIDQSWNPFAWSDDENLATEDMQTWSGTNIASQPVVPKLKPAP